MKEIKGFFGKYFFLSNFFYCDVIFDGRLFKSTEHAFQFAKYPEHLRSSVYEGFKLCDASGSKKLGRNAPLPEGWTDKRNEVMRQVLSSKFSSLNPRLIKLLLDTEDAYLEETNPWGDCYWGVCDGVGQNMLGYMLMARREALKSLTSTPRSTIVSP